MRLPGKVVLGKRKLFSSEVLKDTRRTFHKVVHHQDSVFLSLPYSQTRTLEIGNKFRNNLYDNTPVHLYTPVRL